MQERNLLLSQNEELQANISQKAQEYEDIREKVSNIEEMVGLKISDDENIDVRLDEIDVTIMQQKTFLITFQVAM